MMEILHDEDGMRTVVLSRSCRQDSVKELLVTMDEGQAIFANIQSDGKNRRFRPSAQEVEAFIEAWTKHKADAQAKAEAGQAEWDAKVEATRKRAEAVGAILTAYDSEKYVNFTLKWPASSPLERYNRRWVSGNSALTLSDVQARLKQVEEHMQEVQEAAIDRDVLPFEILSERAKDAGTKLFKTEGSLKHYDMSFPPSHPFHGFWKNDICLTLGQVEYRLRYVLGVLQNPAKEVTTR